MQRLILLSSERQEWWAKCNEEKVHRRISSACRWAKVTVINTGALTWHASAQLAEHR